MSKKKIVTVKPRNAGTMTESAFWGFIRSSLRQKSRFWKPITQCKMKSRRAYKGPLKRQKFEYRCKECSQWFHDKKINVDHIIPAGTLKGRAAAPLAHQAGRRHLCAPRLARRGGGLLRCVY